MTDWLSDPPFSVNIDLVRAVNDIRAAGQRWRNVPEDFLVGVLGREGSTNADHVLKGAAAELQWRSIDAQRHLEIAVRDSTDVQSAHAQRLEALTLASGEQTNRVIDLTERLRKLTVVITWLTVAAVLFGGIQAAAVLVHFYRWMRGW